MLEHVKDYDKAANELCRVAQKACFVAWSPNKYSVYDFGHLDAPVTIFSKPMARQVAKWWHGLRRTRVIQIDYNRTENRFIYRQHM